MEGRIKMVFHKSPRLLFVVALATPIFLLQAWDSNTFESSALVIFLVMLGIAIPVITVLWLPQDRALLGAGVASLLLLFSARFMAPVTLQGDLFTILPLLGILLYFSHIQRLKLHS
jgi:hypothetical protein